MFSIQFKSNFGSLYHKSFQHGLPKLHPFMVFSSLTPCKILTAGIYYQKNFSRTLTISTVSLCFSFLLYYAPSPPLVMPVNRFSRNLHLEDAARDGSKGNEERFIRTWRKGDICYLVAERLVKWSPVVMWKAELVSNDLGYIAKEISSPSVEGELWFFSCCL